MWTVGSSIGPTAPPTYFWTGPLSVTGDNLSLKKIYWIERKEVFQRKLQMISAKMNHISCCLSLSGCVFLATVVYAIGKNGTISGIVSCKFISHALQFVIRC